MNELSFIKSCIITAIEKLDSQSLLKFTGIICGTGLVGVAIVALSGCELSLDSAGIKITKPQSKIN